MLTRIEAMNYGCLRHVEQDIGPFHVLVGPNASGKSTFLDVIALVQDMLRDDLEPAISARAPDYTDLFWSHEGTRFEVALEASVPEELRAAVGSGESQQSREGLSSPNIERCRYELAVGSSGGSDELAILSETLWLGPGRSDAERRSAPETESHCPPSTILTNPQKTNWQCVLSKLQDPERAEPEPIDQFIPETFGEPFALSLGSRRLALAGLQEDESRFPIATWFKRLMRSGIQRVALVGEAVRRPSPRNAARRFLADGSSLPWILKEFLNGEHDTQVRRWIEHARIALPELEGVESVLRPEDGHQYVVIVCPDGLRVPSWLASHGTLRLLALTLLPYLPQTEGVYLIEEPENGIHPTALELVFQALSSIYDGQVLLTTHSPAILGLARPDEILCFAKTEEGAAKIVPGNRHPRLKHWKGEVDLGVLFAGGVLG